LELCQFKKKLVDAEQKTGDGGQMAEDRSQVSGIGHKEQPFQKLRFRSTFDIIEMAEKGVLPDKVMTNTHPQRWTDNPVEWMKELVLQRMKNGVKYVLVKVRKKKGRG